jgi:branched-chain amino acid transport system ATP-binding protein
MAELSLAISDLHAFYGDSHVLHGVSLNVPAGEVVTIVGRNGAGKTTTLRSVMGMIEKRTGSINICGQNVIAAPPEKIARLGVAYVPEERGI